MTQPKKPLQVGERVAAYSGGDRHVGTVERKLSSGAYEIDVESGHLLVHPKQCRRLVKKPRRRIWLFKAYLDGGRVQGSPILLAPPNTSEAWIEFSEVRKKK